MWWCSRLEVNVQEFTLGKAGVVCLKYRDQLPIDHREAIFRTFDMS